MLILTQRKITVNTKSNYFCRLANTTYMPYFNYHAKAKLLIKQGKLVHYEIKDRYNNISPALVLYFDDMRHPIMPIRKERFSEYLELIESIKK